MFLKLNREKLNKIKKKKLKKKDEYAFNYFKNINTIITLTLSNICTKLYFDDL